MTASEISTLMNEILRYVNKSEQIPRAQLQGVKPQHSENARLRLVDEDQTLCHLSFTFDDRHVNIHCHRMKQHPNGDVLEQTITKARILVHTSRHEVTRLVRMLCEAVYTLA